MKTRDFIQEIIDSLKDSSIKIEDIWSKFKNGDIDKDTFEENYRQILSNLKEDIESEEYHPNNLCKYKETCPTPYFEEQNI